ncbi:GntR family transcriptional regulator [Actinoalloteichus sp. GBA129-24]|uniref:GntR family transcriptional regulator n=1 Tax=Actinoalloteichus sp. GBA129-24 TaxID=1612551 RepID=UPI0009528EF3|nr:GntR family transcriptional regulator [Actinoalloteichus sp. GBA129-24]
MQPKQTPATATLAVQIADDIRIKIERGDLQPDAELPTRLDLQATWRCSSTVARHAIDLLRQQGLITSGRGRPSRVRAKPERTRRTSERHQEEKDRVLLPEPDRAAVGVSETDNGVSIDDLKFSTTYDLTKANETLAQLLSIKEGESVLRRIYETKYPDSGHYCAWSESYIPKKLIEQNEKLFDSTEEPWPGGTQHQLWTVGIELGKFIEDVSARMPTTVEQQEWGIEDGVPMIRVTRKSVDTQDKIVEVSHTVFPADRVELTFVTNLTRW